MILEKMIENDKKNLFSNRDGDSIWETTQDI
jgi:hypothetical protein